MHVIIKWYRKCNNANLFVACLLLVVFCLLAVLASSGHAATAQPAQASGLDARLVGTWYWETSVYVPEYGLIKSTSTVKIRADGTFTVREDGTQTGVRIYQGRVVQQGNSLIATTDSGQMYTFRFKLSGSNGLWIGKRLYERK
jgi:hypothetical protein